MIKVKLGCCFFKKKVDPSLKVELKNARKNTSKTRREKQKDKLKAKQDERLRNQMKLVLLSLWLK